MDLCLEGMAGVAEADGQPGRAARLLGAAEALNVGLGGTPDRPSSTCTKQYERQVAALRARRDEEAFAAAWAAGRALSFEAAVAEAVEDSSTLPSEAE
jgi:hypothetical protein